MDTPEHSQNMQTQKTPFSAYALLLIALVALAAGFFLGNQTSVLFPVLKQTENSDSLEHVAQHAPEKRLWHLEGTEALLVGEYGDNMAYDGENVRPVEGTISISVDSANNSGELVAHLENAQYRIARNRTLTGALRFEMKSFNRIPHMPLSPFMQGGIAEGVWLHGNTGQASPVEPLSFSPLAGWGTISIYENDTLVYDNLVGHFMYTERMRRDGKIMNDAGVIYDPSVHAGNRNFVDSNTRDLHLIIHSMFADEENFPPDTHFMNINFQEAVVRRTPDDAQLFVPKDEVPPSGTWPSMRMQAPENIDTIGTSADEGFHQM